MKTPRILVVDAEPGVDGRYAKILAPLGSPQILSATDNASALTLLASEAVDLVIATADPPELDGVELLRSIRQRDAELPVIVLTAEPTAEAAANCLRLGAGDYLVKPVAAD